MEDTKVEDREVRSHSERISGPSVKTGRKRKKSMTMMNLGTKTLVSKGHFPVGLEMTYDVQSYSPCLPGPGSSNPLPMTREVSTSSGTQGHLHPQVRLGDYGTY